MSNPPPIPPQDLPNDIIEMLNDYSSDLLRYVAQYAEELAEYRERETRLTEEAEEDEIKRAS